MARHLCASIRNMHLERDLKRSVRLKLGHLLVFLVVGFLTHGLDTSVYVQVGFGDNATHDEMTEEWCLAQCYIFRSAAVVICVCSVTF